MTKEEKKEKKKEYNRKWREAHPDYFIKKHKEYHSTDKCKDYIKKYRCRPEVKERERELKKEYWKKVKDVENEKRRVINTTPEVLERRRQLYKERKEKNFEKISEQKKQWHEKNKEKRNIERKYKYQNDRLYRIEQVVKSTIKLTYRQIGEKRKKGIETILGCSYEHFLEYIESQFEPWMNWDNYGKYKKNTFNYGWDIDHIIPRSTIKNEEDVFLLNHYTNLRPLCSYYNRHIKKDKITSKNNNKPL